MEQDQLTENERPPKKLRRDYSPIGLDGLFIKQDQPNEDMRHTFKSESDYANIEFDATIQSEPSDLEIQQYDLLLRMALKGYGRTVHVGGNSDVSCFEACIGQSRVAVLGGGAAVPVDEFIRFINSTLSPLEVPLSIKDLNFEDMFEFPCGKPCAIPGPGNCLYMFAAIELAEKYGLRPFMEELRNYATLYQPPTDFRCACCDMKISTADGCSEAEQHGDQFHSDIWRHEPIYCCTSHRLVFYAAAEAYIHGRDCSNIPSVHRTDSHDASLFSVFSSPNVYSSGESLTFGYTSCAMFVPPKLIRGSYMIHIDFARIALDRFLAFLLGVTEVTENGLTRYQKQYHPDLTGEESLEALILNLLKVGSTLWLSFDRAKKIAEQYGLSAKLLPVWGLEIQPGDRPRHLSLSLTCTDCGLSILHTTSTRTDHSCQSRAYFRVKHGNAR